MLFEDGVLLADIQHPNFPEISVTVEKPDELQKMEHFTSMGQFTIPVAVLNPQTGNPIFEEDKDTDGNIKLDKDNNPVLVMKTKDLPSFPVSILVKFLSERIKSIKGFDNKNGPIKWEPSKIHLMFNSKLNVKEDGKPDKPFWSYLNDKVLDDKTFDPDPLVLN